MRERLEGIGWMVALIAVLLMVGAGWIPWR